MLRFERLEKRYGSKTVLDGVGHVFGTGCHALRGPNGSGKSTLLKALAGVERIDGGEVWIGNHSLIDSPVDAKRRLSFVPDTCPVYPFMTGYALLEFVASAKKTSIEPNTLDFAAQLGLSNYLDSRIEQMSLGTQKKTMLVAASIGSPAVLIADEPSNGIDDTARKVIAAFFVETARSATVLFSTHDIAFAELCGATPIGMPVETDPTQMVTDMKHLHVVAANGRSSG
ncbi:Heme-transporting ATPase [Pararobbsia alpina]|uniref:ATP-binding cassette domain-containing protein n=1 Tax=Pararobbsia alpina TaxID=621374 RepID=UPI0039A52B96